MRAVRTSDWWRQLGKRRAVRLALVILVPLYALAGFAGFFAPYHYASQNRATGWAAPMLAEVRIGHDGLWVPGMRSIRDRFGREIAEFDPEVKHRVRWFVAGEPYALFGCLGPFRTHLFGLDENPVGADDVARALDAPLPGTTQMRGRSLAEIAGLLASRSRVAVQLDRDERFVQYVSDTMVPLDVDLGDQTLGEALRRVVSAHRRMDEASRLAWRITPGGIVFTLRDLVLEPRWYLLGSDQIGRDLFSRIVWGSQISLTVGLVGTLVTSLLGLLFGGVAGYVGGLVDFALMRLSDLLMALPAFYLLLALRGVFPADVGSGTAYLLVVLILSFVSWGSFCRLIRGLVMSLRTQEFVIAARALGASHTRCLVRHVIPNTLTATIVWATLAVPHYILGEVALSYLGLGISEPQASWGTLLGAAQSVAALEQHPWVLLPGVFVFLAVLAYNLLGDAIRDAADPHALSPELRHA